MKWLIDFLKGKWLKHPLHPIVVHVPMAMSVAQLTFRRAHRQGHARSGQSGFENIQS
jgi:hypothetical protein